jgi:glucokinase
MTREVVLAGDLGGTKTLLALVAPGEPLDVVARGRFASARFDSLESMVEEFLAQHGARPRRAVFGVAGPVIDRRAQLTNLTYGVDERMLGTRLGLERVRLLNDLEATAFALPLLSSSAFRPLCEGRGRARGDFAVISVGTGLGEALGVDLGDTFTVVAGEGGHVDFAPHDEDSVELLSHLRGELRGHVSKEAVLSGRGIAALFRFVVASGRAAPAVDPWPEPDPNVAITLAGLEGRCPASRLALELFAAHLGAHAGDVALRSLPRGGVFLAGGIPPKLAPLLESSAFRDAFVNKGRFEDELRAIRVEIVTERDAPLLGAAHVAFGEIPGPGRARLSWPIPNPG